MPLPWFDGHLDLTYIADHGQDLLLDSPRVCFPALRAAGVHAAVSTLFVRRRNLSPPSPVDGPYCFSTPDEAHAAALRQLHMHTTWHNQGRISLCSGSHPFAPPSSPNAPLQIILAIEGASCLPTPDHLPAFHAAGVRILSLTWAEGNHYAGGDQSGGDITPLGRELIARCDRLNIIHDVSHLSERAFWSLLDLATGPIIASHSNARALLPAVRAPDRHLSDDQLRALARLAAAGRGGLIGLNLFARFLIPPDQLAARPATIADLLRHADHIAQVTGSRAQLALGSDMDSGFGPDLLPADLQEPRHLSRLADALAQNGWSDPQIHHFSWSNWASLLHP